MSYGFQEQLAVANDYRNLYAQVAELYFGPDFLYWQETDSGRTKAQLAGIDAFVVVSSGKVHTVDTKLDRHDSPRTVLELVSNVEQDKPGWAANPALLNDWFMYVQPARSQALMLPRWELLAVVAEHRDEWIDKAGLEPGYKVLRVPNARYTTFCVAIPTSELVELLGKNCLVQYG